MIQVKRKQFPVGQGGLHAEVVEFEREKVVMVYDCGSISSGKGEQKPIEREIDRLGTFVGEKRIDYLILSHLHEDHINGVKYLKNQGWRVKRLVLPYTTQQEKIFYAAGLIEKNVGGEMFDFAFNPDGYFEGCTLIEVEQESATEEPPEARDDDAPAGNEFLRLGNQSGRIGQGAYATTKFQCDWGIALFNYRNQDVAAWIEQNFPSALPKQIEDWGVEEKKIAVDTYKAALKHFGERNFNLTSLCAFSGCLLGCRCGIYVRRDTCCCDHRNDRHGWIHTGDILLKGGCLQEFTTFFSSYFNRTGVAQLPHHGARNGYDSILNTQANTVSIVCAGERNRYRHPNVDVLHKVQLQRGRLVFVTDNVGTVYEEAINCRCDKLSIAKQKEKIHPPMPNITITGPAFTGPPGEYSF